jgi:hypothetical protein
MTGTPSIASALETGLRLDHSATINPNANIGRPTTAMFMAIDWAALAGRFRSNLIALVVANGNALAPSHSATSIGPGQVNEASPVTTPPQPNTAAILDQFGARAERPIDLRPSDRRSA